jgi:hypothetical protein
MTFPGSPRVLKGGIVLIDPASGQVLPNGVIVLQYNPETLSRTLKIKGMEEGADRSKALRLKEPPVETFKLDAEIHPNRLRRQIARSVYSGIGVRR